MNFQYFFFDTYIGYFLQALPFALLVSAVYGVVRYRRDPATPLYKKIFSCLFVCYMTGLVCLVIGLDIMGNMWYRLLYQMDPERCIRWFAGEFDLTPDFFRNISGEVLGNVLMFLPFGILYPLAQKTPPWKSTVLVGSASVLLIELLQPIVGRAFDINDIILNTLGIVLSASVFFLVKRMLAK